MKTASERERLADLYGRMSDDELLNIARDINGLTDVAREAITAELAKRGPLPAVGVVPTPIPLATTERIVTIAHFMNMPQALTAQSALESAGIPCFLAHDNINRLYWASLVGGTSLQVPEHDLEQAMRVLNDFADMPEEFNVEQAGELQAFDCPSCGSADVELVAEQAQDSAALWKCTACGKQWQMPPSEAN
jgi:predicted RNA-binding Zn-ribbon protein involved in translation (DUF1610 family)